MSNRVQLIVYPAKDLDKAKKFFSTFLGTEPYVDGAYYVGYKTDDLEVGLDPNSSVGPIAYTSTDDIKASVKALTDSGAEIVQDIKDVAQGLLIAQLKDASGNVVGLRQQPKK